MITEEMLNERMRQFGMEPEAYGQQSMQHQGQANQQIQPQEQVYPRHTINKVLDTQAVTPLGNNLRGTLTNTGSAITGGIDAYIDAINKMGQSLTFGAGYKAPPSSIGQAIGIPSNNSAYQLGRPAGEIGAFLTPTAATGKFISAGIPALAKVPGSLKRVGEAGLLSMLFNPENQFEEGKEAAMLQAGLELLPLGGKVGRNIVKRGVGEQYAEKSIEKASQAFNKADAQYNHLLDQSVGKFKNDKLNLKPEIRRYSEKSVQAPLDTGEILYESFGPNTKKLHRQYLRSPTVKNANQLQSSMEKDARKARKATDQTRVENLEEARNMMLDDLGAFLSHWDPKAGQSFDESRRLYREKIVPYKDSGFYDKYLSEEAKEYVKKGHVNKPTIKDIYGDLEKAIKDKYTSLPPEHQLAEMAGDLRFQQNLRAPLAPLAALPRLLSGGGDELSQFIRNDEIANMLEKMYGIASKAYVGSQSFPQENK